jgi:hypothetical protein
MVTAWYMYPQREQKARQKQNLDRYNFTFAQSFERNVKCLRSKYYCEDLLKILSRCLGRRRRFYINNYVCEDSDSLLMSLKKILSRSRRCLGRRLHINNYVCEDSDSLFISLKKILSRCLGRRRGFYINNYVCEDSDSLLMSLKNVNKRCLGRRLHINNYVCEDSFVK